MPVTKYGVYLAFPPATDLRHQGLGRYMASLLHGVGASKDVRFVVVCPSWSQRDLDDLLTMEGVPRDHIEIITPPAIPPILRVLETLQRYRERWRGRSLLKRWLRGVHRLLYRYVDNLAWRLARASSTAALIPLAPELIVVAAVLVVYAPILLVLGLLQLGLARSRLARGVRLRLAEMTAPVQRLLQRPKESSFVLRVYRYMEEAETERLLRIVADQPQVRAWYCPTAFWPAFNQIPAPRLMCVPDVVLTDFPAGFANVGGERFETTFKAVEQAIRSGQAFVTYSEAVKQRTMVERYAARPEDVHVVPHAPHDLSRWVTVTGFDDNEAAARHYCEWLLTVAMHRSTNRGYSHEFMNGAVDFLIYASQFRPNKNVVTLLRAYEHLLRHRFIGYKLILTGNPADWDPIESFIAEHRLENDVLCLHGLSIRELAACYKSAALAVNPSLSEGGFPFTFSEALSVETPVVMARIPVTEEVVTDPDLQRMMLFDPYDWRDMAARIEWAIGNRTTLLARQKALYAEIAHRTWRDVAAEHVAILDRLAAMHDRASAST